MVANGDEAILGLQLMSILSSLPRTLTLMLARKKNALTNINRRAIASSDPTHPEDYLKTRWNKKNKSWSGHTIPGTARTTYGGNKL